MKLRAARATISLLIGIELPGADPWPYGLTEANRINLETLMQYSQEQGLVGRKMALEELFAATEAHFIADMEAALIAGVGLGTGAALARAFARGD